MKQCPVCSVKNKNDARFCSGCGTNLENVPILPDGTDELLSKTNGFLRAGTELLKKATTSGEGKTKKAKKGEKILQFPQSGTTSSGFEPAADSAQGTMQASSSWEEAAMQISKQPSENKSTWANAVNLSSTMVEHYPFFQAEDEKTLAVLGEKFAAADLEGLYQGPYAILTKERLYIKNEAGNFVVDTSDIQTTDSNQVKVKGWALIVAGVLNVFSILYKVLPVVTSGRFLRYFSASILPAVVFGFAVGAAAYFYTRKKYLLAGFALCVSSIVSLASPLCLIAVPFSIIYTISAWKYTNTPPSFSIFCTRGAFSFALTNYPPQETASFQMKAAPFCKGQPAVGGFTAAPASSMSHTYVSGPKPKRKWIAVVCIIAVVITVLCVVGYKLTHCKYPGCNESVYESGYCSYHYKLYLTDQKAHEFHNDANNFFDELFG